MKVQEIMTIAPACCAPEESIAEAAATMARFDIGIVLVIEKLDTHAKLVGVLTDRDLCLRVLAAGKDPASLTVGECMSTKLVKCAPGEEVDLILNRMARAKVRRLPVTGKNMEAVGLVSLDDVVRLKAAGEAEICRALAAICAPIKTAHKAAA